MTFFDQIINENDKSYLVLEEALLNVDKAVFAYETARKYEEFRLRELECRCVMESGGVLELMQIYEAGEEANPPKDKGLLKKAWEAIINAFRAIKNKLFGENKPKLEELPKETKLPKILVAIVKAFPGAWNSAKSAFSDVKKTIKEHKGLTSLFMLLTGVGISEAIKSVKSKISEAKHSSDEETISISNVIEAYNAIEDATNTLEKFSNNCKNADGVPEEDHNIIQKLQTLMSEIGTTLKIKIDTIKKKGIRDKKDQISEGTDNSDNKDNQSTDNQKDDEKNTNTNQNSDNNEKTSGDTAKTIEAKLRASLKAKGKARRERNNILKDFKSITDTNTAREKAIDIAGKYGLEVNFDESTNEIHFEDEEMFLEEVKLDMYLGID